MKCHLGALTPHDFLPQSQIRVEGAVAVFNFTSYQAREREEIKRVFHWLCLGVAHGISTHDSLPRISHRVLTHSQKNQVVPSYLAPGRGENSWQTALMNTQTGIPSAP